MSFPRYTEYKDSGVEWLGEVPGHWYAGRFSRAIEAIKDGTHGTFERVPAGRPLLSAKNVQDGYVLVADDESMVSESDHLSITANGFPQKGDLLLTIVGTIGRSCVYEFDDSLAFQRSVCFIRLLQGNETKFFYYFTQSKFFQEQLVSRSKSAAQGGVYMGDVVATSIVYPPLPEQTQIATFLDRETGKINALVAEQRRLMELLKEKRQAVISHAVTQGLNPDAPMKPSGIEWLGDVPEHWDLMAMKRLFRLVVEPAPDDNDHELLSLYTEIGVRPRKSLEAKGNKATTTDGYWMVKKGDLIVNKLLAWMGAIGISDYDGVTSPAYDILRQKVHLEPRYYDFLLRCGICFTEFRRYSRGIMDMRLRLYFDELGQFLMPYPSKEEQREIVEFLQQELSKFDTLTAEAQRAIDLLQERRTALISAAVTGQIDVRNAVTT